MRYEEIRLVLTSIVKALNLISRGDLRIEDTVKEAAGRLTFLRDQADPLIEDIAAGLDALTARVDEIEPSCECNALRKQVQELQNRVDFLSERASKSEVDRAPADGHLRLCLLLMQQGIPWSSVVEMTEPDRVALAQAIVDMHHEVRRVDG
jgi:hypothetical protein